MTPFDDAPPSSTQPMSDERYKSLMNDDSLKLTQAEIDVGWHFCVEWDGLLVGPGSHELFCCRCWPKTHPVYKTIPPDEAEHATDPYDDID